MNELQFAPNLEPSLTDELRASIADWDPELRTFLPNLPDTIRVEIIESPTSEEQTKAELDWSYGVNGATLTPDTVRIEINTRAQLEQAKLMNAFKETVFHEFTHVARGYSFESVGLTLLTVALEEGLATKFEMLKAGANPWYGDYGDRETMLATLEEVRAADQQAEKDWERWKFYDPGTDRHWILYRLGTFMVDEALANNPSAEIQDIIQLTHTQILELSGL